MKKYEMMYILSPDLNVEDLEKETTKIEEIIKKNNGQIEEKESLGLKEFTYPIKKKENGNYYLMYFLGTGEVVKELDRIMKINKNVLRQLIIAR